MSKITVSTEMAKIGISKSLVKEYTNSDGRVVYLNNGTEFQIYIKNPETDTIGVRISLNGNDLGNMLVLKPGQSVWLERYLNDNKKFLFSTYDVENTNEMINAISKNGKVELSFYREKPICHNSNVLYRSSILWDNDYARYQSSYGSSLCSNPLDSFETLSLSCCDTSNTIKAIETGNTTKAIETGRVEMGSNSNQKFENIDINFYTFPFKNETILILPSSRKASTVNDTRRKYCSKCGKKVKPTDKYCSSCGSKLD